MSNLNVDSKRAVDNMIDRLKVEDYDKLLHNQQKQLKKLILRNSKYDFDIFYGPSGSDLCYFPIMFSRIMNPEKPIFSIVTCPEELGTGSNTAIKGKYFFGTNQSGLPKWNFFLPYEDIDFLENVKKNCILGIGSTVLKSFKENLVILGSPAKVLKKNI